MLIKCPECELQVSDKAMSCPHCGYPLKGPAKPKVPKYNKKRKLPNGFGQITELKSRNLRKPFRAMITVGVNANGHPISKLLKPTAYFETYNEAYEALIEYNKDPYTLEECITVKELYDRWSKEYFKTLKSSSSHRTIESAWKCCSDVEKIKVRDLRARHIKGCMDGAKSPNLKSRVKSLFNLMLDYALEYEIVSINYARTFNISTEIIQEQENMSRAHIAFTDEEMSILWNHVSDPTVKMILIQCYSGWRPQELCLLRLEDIYLDRKTIRGGMKTQAGTNRIVPIHTRIQPIVEELYNRGIAEEREYLFCCTDSHTHHSSKMTYDKYKYRFTNVINELGLNANHRPHDPRKQFVTMAKKYGVDEYAIKRIVGHTITDITEKVYTERDDTWLVNEMNKIELKK